jgi:GMP reductase
MAIDEKLKFICLDVANGYREDFLQFVRKTRKEFNDKIIIAGNVATREMTEALILAGADIVKVGIGPGSVCTTRKVAGVGYPQLSAISECADAAHGLAGHVMSDGGCTSPGDVAKAFAAGADFVMLGGMLAGHDESGGELKTKENGKQYKSFYGMSSAKAMKTYFGEVAKHRAPEGKEVEVPYRGPVEITVQSILGGIRSACSYVGARRIKDLPKCTTFVRVTITTNEIYTIHENS